MTDINQKMAEWETKSARRHTGERLIAFEVANEPGWYTLDDHPGQRVTLDDLRLLADLRGVQLVLMDAEQVPEVDDIL